MDPIRSDLTELDNRITHLTAQIHELETDMHKHRRTTRVWAWINRWALPIVVGVLIVLVLGAVVSCGPAPQDTGDAPAKTSDSKPAKAAPAKPKLVPHPEVAAELPKGATEVYPFEGDTEGPVSTTDGKVIRWQTGVRVEFLSAKIADRRAVDYEMDVEDTEAQGIRDDWTAVTVRTRVSSWDPSITLPQDTMMGYSMDGLLYGPNLTPGSEVSHAYGHENELYPAKDPTRITHAHPFEDWRTYTVPTKHLNELALNVMFNETDERYTFTGITVTR